MSSIQYFIFLTLNLFETSGIKLMTLRIRINKEWLKKTMFEKSYEKLC